MLTLYETFYKLSADPFRLSPDHRFSFGHRSYARAKAYLEYALHRGEGFITITGSAGTGKTTLINQILSEVDRGRLQVATLTTTQLEGKDLLQMVAALFGLKYEEESKASLLLEIEELLKQLNQRGRRAVLIVDEAQGLSPGAVEELRLLANLQFNHRLLLQVFLVGQEQLRDMVRAPAMEHLRQRIVAASHLEPLTLDEMISYIEHRLMRVGWQGDPAITEDALRLVHRFSGGVPRRVNLICSRLFLYGSMEEKHELGGSDARSIIDDLQEELLVAPEAEGTAPPQQHDADAADQGEAPPRRLPRPGAKPEGSITGGPGPAAVMEATEGPALEDGADMALRERDIWGEIEDLEKELKSTSRGMVDEALLGANAASRAAAGQGSVRSIHHNAVGAAVSKAMSRRSSTTSSARTGGEQQTPATAPARQAKPRFHTVPREPAEGGVGEDSERPALLVEADEAPRAFRRESPALRSPRKRRWGVVLVLLALGLGLAGAIGWQQRERSAGLDFEISGTIQRDAGDTAASDVADPEILSDASPTALEEATGIEPGSGAGREMPGAAELARVAGPEVTGADGSAATTTVSEAPPEMGVESSAPSAATPQNSVAASSVEADALQKTAASAVPEGDSDETAGVRDASAARADDASGAETPDAVSANAATQLSAESQPTTSIEAERARLRREAEQRFRQELGRSEAKVAPADPANSSSRKVAAQKPQASVAVQPAPVPAPVPQPKQRDTAARTSSAGAPATDANPVPASRPKTAAAPLASAQADVAAVTPALPSSPDQLRRLLLQGQWTSQGKPASLLPSEITFCSAAGADIKCWSVPRKTTTKYGNALYKVEATLSGFSADGEFQLAYRTLVKLVDSAETADGVLLRGAADDDTGWQATERSMRCELSQSDQVLCRSATGTVRDYRRAGSGSKS